MPQPCYAARNILLACACIKQSGASRCHNRQAVRFLGRFFRSTRIALHENLANAPRKQTGNSDNVHGGTWVIACVRMMNESHKTCNKIKLKEKIDNEQQTSYICAAIPNSIFNPLCSHTQAELRAAVALSFAASASRRTLVTPQLSIHFPLKSGRGILKLVGFRPRCSPPLH